MIYEDHSEERLKVDYDLISDIVEESNETKSFFTENNIFRSLILDYVT